MIIFHKINTVGSKWQSLKTLCSRIPPDKQLRFPPTTAVSLHPSLLGGPRFRVPGPEPKGNPSPAGRIAYSPVIHLHGLRLRSRLWLQRNSCARVQSQDLHPSSEWHQACCQDSHPRTGSSAQLGRGSLWLCAQVLTALGRLDLGHQFLHTGYVPVLHGLDQLLLSPHRRPVGAVAM